jgi:hypothetical protein
MPLDPEFLPAVLDQFSGSAETAAFALASLDQVLSRLSGNRLLRQEDLAALRAELASRAGQRHLRLATPQSSERSPATQEAALIPPVFCHATADRSRTPILPAM